MQPKFDQFWAGQISAFKGVLKIIDTFEVKEVDLEKEIQQHINDCLEDNPEWAGEIENIFPELKESEDERMRKALIRFFQWFPYDRLNDENLKPKEAIAWLEKQGEQKPKWGDDDEQYLLVCKNALRKYQVSDKWDADIISKWLEDKLKQGEQKPKWTEEDEERLQSCISTLQGKGLMGGVDTINTKWLKSLKQRQVESKWIEEDSKMLGTLIAIFEVNYPDEFYKVNPIGTTDMQGIHSSEIVKWLRTIKQRMEE